MTEHLHVPGSANDANTDLSGHSSVTLVNGSSVDVSSDALSFAELEGRDLSEQMEALDQRLVKETRIKEGAENMLKMPLEDAFRVQVQAEMDIAKSTIEAITSRRNALQRALESGQTAESRAPPSPLQRRLPRVTRYENIEERDDFRTTLQSATACISALTVLARPAAVSPASSSSSSDKELPDLDHQFTETMSKLVQTLQRSLRVRYELDLVSVIQAMIPALADNRSKKCRATAYRLLRHALVDADSVRKLEEQHLDWYIVRSLTRDSKYAVEKEQVIKLIRTIVEIGSVRRGPGVPGKVPLSEAVMRAFIAVAEHVEEPFRPVCIQTLAEILLIDVDLIARTGGIRFLLHCLGDGPTELTPILAAAFLHVVDSPRTRAYLKLGTDLEMALIAVTDAYGKGLEHSDRMKSCTKVIQLMLRTWSGLLYLCMDNMRAIRSLINTLRIPSMENRDIVLDMFFELLGIKSTSWYQTFIDGRRLTIYHRNRTATSKKESDASTSERVTPTLRLTDQYIGLLVLVFTNAGLLEALSSMLEETVTGSNLSRKATLLMAEVLQLATRILPLSVAAKIQAIPEIFQMASSYGDSEHRIIGTSALSAIDSVNRNRVRLNPGQSKGSRNRANSIEDPVRRGQRQVEQVKLKMGMQMDDRTFQASLLETQVMLTKEYSKWNFETLQELIEGPLLNPKRMEEAIKGARFIRRLMSFFHPFSHRFSDMPRNQANTRWVRLGCSLLTTLLSSSDGVRYLSTEDQFLVQIVKSFAQLDPFNGVPESDPIFSKKRVAEKLTYGYLEMLGTLSKHKEGIELMEKFKVFTAFYHLSELKSREDLIKGIIENLDYSFDGHPRIVLSKALTSSYKHVRLYATEHLGELIQNSPSANAWTLRLLLTQLYDPAPEVRRLAVQILEEACESKDILQMVVEMRPTMEHLGEIGDSLHLKFLSTPMGFRYLYDGGYIDREMDSWFHERNMYYVVQIEVYLSRVFCSLGATEDDDDPASFDGTVPPHFYGEMSKTELGCQILQEKGHFTEFADFIRAHGHESEDMEIIMKLKSILWAVGNVGATEGGLPFLEEEELIPAVLDIADNSLIPSVRGTCFFVLGLVSSTSQGAEILDDFGWEATLSPLGLPTGLCIPMDLERFLFIPPWTQHAPETVQTSLVAPTSDAERDVIAAIHNLANTVIANSASRSLAKMKSRAEYRPIFSSTAMLYRAMHIMSTQRYRLPVRRHILDLFSIDLDKQVVEELLRHGKELQTPPGASLDNNRQSMINHTTHLEESDEDEDDFGEMTRSQVVEKQPALSLRPVSRIVGFAAA